MIRRPKARVWDKPATCSVHYRGIDYDLSVLEDCDNLVIAVSHYSTGIDEKSLVLKLIQHTFTSLGKMKKHYQKGYRAGRKETI